jgi:hypothetical protein
VRNISKHIDKQTQRERKHDQTQNFHTFVLTWNTIGMYQVRTITVVDLNLSIIALSLAIRTDSECSMCILSQYESIETSTKQITQNTQD